MKFWLAILGFAVAASAFAADDASKPVVGISAADARRHVARLAKPNAAVGWNENLPLLDAVVFSLAPEQPPLAELIVKTRAAAWTAPSWLMDAKVDEFLRDQATLFAGRELARQQRYDEALPLLRMLKASHVVDPATLFFFRASCEQALHRRDEALASIELLEALPSIPNRYRLVANQLKERMQRLERESLGGVAHDMRDLRRRFEIGKADAKAVELEKDVIARLDKMIEEAEKQQSSQQGSSSGSDKSSGPAPDSRPLGGKGEGKVDVRAFKDGGGWGNLPDKERERALQDLGRDFPPHYRDAVEQYFRRLAASKDRK